MKILVVDDSSFSRKMIIKAIPEDIKSRSEIYEAENGKEAVEKYEEIKPDLVFLDLTMPVMDGFEALYHIRSKHPDAVVIIISADIQQQAVREVMELGAKAFVKKPISPEKMKEIFDKFVEN